MPAKRTQSRSPRPTTPTVGRKTSAGWKNTFGTAALSDEGEEFADEPYVINRKGEREVMQLGKIGDRIFSLMSPAYGGRRLRGINRIKLETQVNSRVMDRSGITTSEIDKTIVDVCRALSAEHGDYAALAARVNISDLQKQQTRSFSETYAWVATRKRHRLSEGFLRLVRENAEVIDQRIDEQRDYINIGFSAATLMRSYLMRDPENHQVIVETPQYLYMRVALAIHALDPGPKGGEPESNPERLQFRLEEAFKVYDDLSNKRISHATPTMINAGTTIPQYSSCFQAEADDDLDNLYQVIKDTAMMSKYAGGVSISLSRVRSEGQLIQSSGSESSGIRPYLGLAMASQKYADQGRTRPGAFAMYLEPWHADVMGFLEAAWPIGAMHDLRENAPTLKYALWVPDLFMRVVASELDARRRAGEGEDVDVMEAGAWYLFSPDDAPGLTEVYDERGRGHPDGGGGAFTDLYTRYVKEGRAKKRILASELLQQVTKTLALTGTPYILFKDAINRQSNLTIPSRLAPPGGSSPLAEEGLTIVNSNLCAEITIPCRSREGKPEETLYSVCTIASVNLASLVLNDLTAPERVRIDWVALIDAAGTLATNLDLIIDLNLDPAEGCRRSNDLYRPIGIGVMGLADVFVRFSYPFGSVEAIELDRAIHACLYFGAMYQSSERGKRLGNFPHFEKSATARGLLQPDLAAHEGGLPPDWAQRVETTTGGVLTAERWDALREQCRKHLRNGYVTALMPTATSSNAVGVNECFEPYTSHQYARKTNAGEWLLLNPHLVAELSRLKIWTPKTSALLTKTGGSIASWDGQDGRPYVPEPLRKVYTTAREMDQLHIVKHAAARNPFVSQSQSMNCYHQNIRLPELLRIWLTGWKLGLKTGSYYMHSMPAGKTQNLATTAVGAAGKEGADDITDGAEGAPDRT